MNLRDGDYRPEVHGRHPIPPRYKLAVMTDYGWEDILAGEFPRTVGAAFDIRARAFGAIWVQEDRADSEYEMTVAQWSWGLLDWRFVRRGLYPEAQAAADGYRSTGIIYGITREEWREWCER